MKEKRSDGGRATAAGRGYGSRWRKARLAFLRLHPLCAFCERLGLVVAATVVDHRDPHRGDPAKFWDGKNRQPLCEECHNRHKQRLEMSGSLSGCDLNGMPLDDNHHWNKK